MKIYDQYTDQPTEWFCQWKNNSLFFALINSSKLSPRLFSWLKPNENMDENLYKKKVLLYKKKIEDFATTEDLPCKSLLCLKNKHWVVYLSSDGNSATVLDSRTYSSYNKIPLSSLQGQKIIRPENIEISSKLDWLPFDLDEYTKDPLLNSKHKEFSKKNKGASKNFLKGSF